MSLYKKSYDNSSRFQSFSSCMSNSHQIPTSIASLGGDLPVYSGLGEGNLKINIVKKKTTNSHTDKKKGGGEEGDTL